MSQKTTSATDAREGWAGGKRRPRFMFARKNMTLGLCRLSAEHLCHYLEDSYALYFNQGSLSKFRRDTKTHIIPAHSTMFISFSENAAIKNLCPCPLYTKVFQSGASYWMPLSECAANYPRSRWLSTLFALFIKHIELRANCVRLTCLSARN